MGKNGSYGPTHEEGIRLGEVAAVNKCELRYSHTNVPPQISLSSVITHSVICASISFYSSSAVIIVMLLFLRPLLQLRAALGSSH